METVIVEFDGSSAYIPEGTSAPFFDAIQRLLCVELYIGRSGLAEPTSVCFCWDGQSVPGLALSQMPDEDAMQEFREVLDATAGFWDDIDNPLELYTYWGSDAEGKDIYRHIGTLTVRECLADGVMNEDGVMFVSRMVAIMTEAELQQRSLDAGLFQELLAAAREDGRELGIDAFSEAELTNKSLLAHLLVSVLEGMLDQPLQNAERYFTLRLDMTCTSLLICACRPGGWSTLDDYQQAYNAATAAGWNISEESLGAFIARKLTASPDTPEAP